MTMTRQFRTSPILVALASAVSCSSPTSLPSGEPQADGIILTVQSSPMRILVRGNEECGTYFSVTSDTKIIRAVDSATRVKAAVADLQPGVKARAWASGAIAESCPAQAHASAVLLLP